MEIDWRGDELLLWLTHYEIQGFCDLMNRCDADDGGIECHLQNSGVIVVDLANICREHGIDPENILERELQ